MTTKRLPQKQRLSNPHPQSVLSVVALSKNSAGVCVRRSGIEEVASIVSHLDLGKLTGRDDLLGPFQLATATRGLQLLREVGILMSRFKHFTLLLDAIEHFTEISTLRNVGCF